MLVTLFVRIRHLGRYDLATELGCYVGVGDAPYTGIDWGDVLTTLAATLLVFDTAAADSRNICTRGFVPTIRALKMRLALMLAAQDAAKALAADVVLDNP